MAQQELLCEVRKELDRRHGRYMEQYAAINEDLKAFRLDIHQELGQVSTKLSDCADSFTPMQQANNDIFQEFKELLSDIKALLKQQQIQRPDAGDSSQTGSEVQAQISRPPRGCLDISIPRFSTGNPANWIYQTEACFQYCNISPADYVLVASIHLDRPASTWFQLLLRDGQCRDWEAFKVALKLRFGPSEYEDPFGKLTKLMQTTSVSAYYECFEDLSCQISGLSAEMLLSIFISGLKPDIKAQVLARNPNNLHETFSLARLFDEQFA